MAIFVDLTFVQSSAGQTEANETENRLDRKYAAINNIEFITDLEQSTLFTNRSDQITGLSRQYNSTITGLIDKHAPLITRVITIRQRTPWFSEDLSEANRQLRRAERRWRQTRLTVHRDMFTSLRDTYRRELITMKSAYFCDKIEESTRNIKSIYRVANALILGTLRHRLGTSGCL